MKSYEVVRSIIIDVLFDWLYCANTVVCLSVFVRIKRVKRVYSSVKVVLFRIDIIIDVQSMVLTRVYRRVINVIWD